MESAATPSRPRDGKNPFSFLFLHNYIGGGGFTTKKKKRVARDLLLLLFFFFF